MMSDQGLSGLSPDQVKNLVSVMLEQVDAKLGEIKSAADSPWVADMFEMQMLMNKLSQLSEMTSSLVSETNSAIQSMARNVKS
jgi:hypothetical protein